MLHETCAFARIIQVHEYTALTSRSMKKQLLIVLCVCSHSLPAAAHHGFGRFMMNTDVEIYGTLVSMDVVNPHSYMNLEVMSEDGQPFEMRCEMRAAMLLKRSGWSEEMFVAGLPVQEPGIRTAMIRGPAASVMHADEHPCEELTFDFSEEGASAP
jgi:hypothetical protein